MGDAHVVDRAEVLLAPVEVGRDGQAVPEVLGLDEVAGAAHVEHDRHARLLRSCPHGVEPDVAGRVVGRAAAGDEQGGRTHLDGLVGHGRRPVEVDQRDVAGG
jgi:hypothetical protein